MIPHTQLIVDDNIGSCFATCLASVLDLPLEFVPNFRLLQEETPNICMITEADKWLRTNHKKRLISIELYDPNDGPNKGEPLTTQCILNRLAGMDPNELVILSGESPRRQEDGRKKYHCVVAKPCVWGFDLVHDPHPDRLGIIGQPYGVKWIVPL